MRSVVLAFSGGVDSAFLLKAISLSGAHALAVTARSETMPEREFLAASRMADLAGVPHRVIETRELEDPRFACNPKDRCFYCKDELFSRLSGIAEQEGYAFVLDGANMDDLSDHRPGRQAALKHGVRSPLIEAGFTKAEIREHSRFLGLETWDKPASPCLSSRFPYGTPITRDSLRRVEKAEEFLRERGLADLRVRSHAETARIELPAERIGAMLDRTMREETVSYFKTLGFKYITLDLEGFRSGRLNE